MGILICYINFNFSLTIELVSLKDEKQTRNKSRTKMLFLIGKLRFGSGERIDLINEK